MRRSSSRNAARAGRPGSGGRWGGRRRAARASGSIVPGRVGCVGMATGRCYTLRQMSRERNSDALLDRPLNARSVIASLLLGVHPPRLPGARIVRWCALFGIAEGTARVALSRMVDRGSSRTTTASTSSPAGCASAAAARRTGAWSRRSVAWDGAWRIGVVGGAATRRRRPRRAARRDAAASLRRSCARASGPVRQPPAAAGRRGVDVVGAQCAWWDGDADPDDPARTRRRSSSPAPGRRAARTCCHGARRARPDASTGARRRRSRRRVPARRGGADAVSAPIRSSRTRSAPVVAGRPTAGSAYARVPEHVRGRRP